MSDARKTSLPLAAPPIPPGPRAIEADGRPVQADGNGVVPGGRPVEERIRRVIELIRPAIQSDGGDVEYLGLTAAGIVQIRLHGACVGCPSSAITLQMGIERNLREHIPEVRGVEALD